ncbi:MAG TPA: DUF1554 domain-containing protein, partial [Nannocystis exedens]|nr:DUF1554 domain-containing protein [Nannocystis exedens]
GDGVTQEGVEECDDGNEDDSDGCTSNCEVDVRTVFITKGVYDGDLGGLTGADSICQGLAVGSQIEGTFKAWLSTVQESAADRLEHANVPYVLLDEESTHVAENWDDLVDGTILNSIALTEEGKPVGGTLAVWTGTKPDGSKAPMACVGWMSKMNGKNGTTGKRTSTGGTWTEDVTRECDSKSHIYCIEQVP